MKSMIKTFAMLSLSACILVGGAVSSFAAGPDASVVIGHGTSGCDTEARAEIVARMEKGGTTTTYTICSSCGDVNGESCLSGIVTTPSPTSAAWRPTPACWTTAGG